MTIGESFNPHLHFIGAFIPNCILCRPEITPGAKLCYGRLLQYSGKNGTCFPRQSTLASELGVSERQVRNYLAELEDCGLIQPTQRGLGQSNVYNFVWHKWLEASSRPETDSSLTGNILPVRPETDSSLTGNILPVRPEAGCRPDRKHIAGPLCSKRITEENHLKSTAAAPLKAFTDAWVENYPKYHRGTKYVFAGVKDGSASSRLIKTGIPPGELIQIAKQAWAKPALFNCRQAASIAGFASRLNEIRSELNGGLEMDLSTDSEGKPNF